MFWAIFIQYLYSYCMPSNYPIISMNKSIPTTSSRPTPFYSYQWTLLPKASICFCKSLMQGNCSDCPTFRSILLQTIVDLSHSLKQAGLPVLSKERSHIEVYSQLVLTSSRADSTSFETLKAYTGQSPRKGQGKFQ